VGGRDHRVALPRTNCLKIWYEKEKKKKKEEAPKQKQNIENVNIVSNSTPILL
jgi:hypothetical protein